MVELAFWPSEIRRTCLPSLMAAAFALLLAGIPATPAGAEQPGEQGAAAQSLARLPRKHAAVVVKSPEITRMTLDGWASLSQGYDPLGKPDAKVDLRAHDDADADIIVYDKKFKRPTQDLTIDEIGAEPSQSDAAQPVVPFLGSGCDKGSACIDPGQQGLFSTLPTLFGSH